MSTLIFGKYEIIRRLAVGGMGEIFLARQTHVEGFERLVILKSLLPSRASDKDFVEQFLDEARVAATLSHANIVNVFEVGADQGIYFIAMEYIPGEAVSGLLEAAQARGERLPYQISARIMLDAARGLHHAHTAKGIDGQPLAIVHRDISPHNIMVRDDGVTKIVDFGIARAANRATHTATGLVKGKLGYMAPEQLLGAEVGPTTDLYSLGVVLWEMCVGERLRPQSEQQMDLLKSILEQPIQPAQQANPETPEPLADIIERLGRPRPEERFESAHEVATALQAYVDASEAATDDQAVAAVVEQLVGDELQNRTRDLTPAPTNFLIQLKGGPPEEGTKALGATAVAGKSSEDSAAAAPPPRQRSTSLLLGLLLGLVVIGAWWVSRPAPDDVASLEPPAESAAPVVGSPTQERAAEEPATAESAAPPVAEPATKKSAPARQPRRAKRRPAKRPPAEPARPPAAPVAAEGMVTVHTEPWTKVSIDGGPYKVSPLYRVRMTAGKHQLHLLNPDDGIDARFSLTVKGGEQQKLRLRCEAARCAPR